MKIPRTIKIDCYEIEIIQPVVMDELGTADTTHNEIHVCQEQDGRNLKEPVRTQTFLHEIIHHINEIYHLGLTEEQTDILSTKILTTFRDNKLNFLEE